MARRIKRDDLVMVVTGKDKGQTGRVVRVIAERDRVIVEGLNKVVRHQGPQKFRETGKVEREAPLHLSNVMLVDPSTQKPTRVRAGKDADGKKIRVAAKSGTALDA